MMKSTQKRESDAMLRILRHVIGVHGDGKPRRVRLTKRQKEVLTWLAEEGSIPQIAKRHFVAKGTLQKHMDNIGKTVGCRKREALVWWGIQAGYITPGWRMKNT